MSRLLPAALLCAAFPAIAADWTEISREQGRTVELDRASVLVSDAGTKVAWGRITLSKGEAAGAGYAAIHVLNRYDCRSQTFITIKRVYQDAAGLTLREEPSTSQTPVRIQPNSLDDRFYKQVCKPVTVSELGRIANAAMGRAEQPSRLQLAKEEVTTDLPPEMPKPRTRHAPNFPPVETQSAPATMNSPAAANHAAPAMPAALPRGSEPVRVYSPPMRRAPPPKAAAVAPARASEPVHWSYEGEGGPARWGSLQPEFAVCAKGQRQSPIDIHDGIKVELDPLQLDYKPSYFRIADNGHSIQANVGSGLFLKVMGHSYELQQIHFHRPAEERIDGRSFEMSAHLVHKDLDGRLAVIAVLIERGNANPLVQTLWNNLPLEKYESYSPSVPINPTDLLPADPRYYTYMGSLTTPPCTEGVLWMVMKQPVQLSPEQIAIFSRFYSNNARPVQPLDGRTIKESR
ncbi:carbonic anhydrase family protein [Niveibacterium sp. SC-1]|uniref:carbonic anhydrase n=1 Tax=Niveibacterium sp. SC-1 TaxID=3135646 RepID=UPI00311EA194